MEAEAGIRDGADSSLLAQERELRAKLNEVNRKPFRAQGHPASDELAATLEREQRSLLRDLDILQNDIRDRNPKYAAMTRPEPLSLSEIQERKLLDLDSLMLVYSLGEERSFLWYIPPRGPMKSYILPARSWIEDIARQVREAWSREGRPMAKNSNRWAASLSKILLGPVAKELGTKRLVVVADGALQYVPFAALSVPSEAVMSESEASASLLVREHEIVNLPSVSALGTLRRELGGRDRAERLIAVIADPIFSSNDPRVSQKGEKEGSRASAGDLARAARDAGIEGFEPLPYTAREAQAIRLFVKEGQRFEALGFDASRATVMSGTLKEYRILHFATHGILDAKQPELSGLVLSLVDSEGHSQDGFLRSYEICDLDLHAELAVLSACQTGLGGEIRGEGLIGLTRSFMYAGVPRVVVSLWKVSDQGTAELMRRFYKGLFKEGLAPSAALRCAQISMLSDRTLSDPYYWASFIFQGDWKLDKVLSPESIEPPPSGTKTAVRSNNDLPPPGSAEPFRCPELD